MNQWSAPDPLRVRQRTQPSPTGNAEPHTPVPPSPTDAPDDALDAPHVGGAVTSSVGRWRLLAIGVQVFAAVGALIVLVLRPEDVGDLVSRCAALAVVLVSISAISGQRDPASRSRVRIGSATLATAAAILVIIDPDRWISPIGRIVGIVSVLVGLVLLGAGARRRGGGPNVRRAVGAIAVGLVLFLAFDALSQSLAIVAVVLAVGTAVVRVGVQMGIAEVDPPATNRPLLLRWVDAKGKSRQRRGDIYEQVFFEGDDASARIGRFMLMMLFASVISAAGVLSDSTAVVIGAMLVAPLIAPMMGMGLSLATGWPNRLGRSTLIVLGGVVIAVGTGWVLAATGLAVNLASNSQIGSRSSPRIVDLVIAVAAGAAGAYAISRKDASSSLPGVAVAIALVPPLSVVGVTAQRGDWEQASGTLLLFLTNLVAIILAGGVVFVLTGVVPIRRFAENQHRVRTAIATVGVLALLVVGGLTINGRQITADALDQDTATGVVKAWLGDDADFAIVSIEVADGDIAVVLAGPGDPPSAQSLVDELASALTDGVNLDLQWIPRNRLVVSSTD